MSRFESEIPATVSRVWPGLGHWNLYFMLKFALHWGGYLNVQVLPNLLFAAFLLMPLGRRLDAIARRSIAVPVAVVLLYGDTWLPSLGLWAAWPSLADLSSGHLLALAGRLIDWNLCGWLLVLAVAYAYIHPWLRMTTLSLAGLVWLSCTSVLASYPNDEADVSRSSAPGYTASRPDGMVDSYLQQFYAVQAERRMTFSPSTAAGQPFDLLFINIDSMAWDDLELNGLREHPLLRQMDVLFDRFNSAASERVPATLRLLRAGCGQTPLRQLYAPADDTCLLFDELGKQGFVGETLLNHTGRQEGFLNAVQTLGSVPGPETNLSHLRPMLSGPDGSPILRDGEVLDLWWKLRQQQPQSRVALLYNTLTLHEGNRIVTADGGTRRADYKERAQALLDDLNGFIAQLEQSGRRVVMVIIPDHGAALRGDRMQLPGMYGIPSPSITQVPVGIKLIGMGRNPRSTPLHITEPSSYLALAQIIDRLYTAPSGAEDLQPDWQSLLAQLMQTPLVSESEGSVLLDYAATPYVRIKEKDAWLPYRSVTP